MFEITIKFTGRWFICGLLVLGCSDLEPRLPKQVVDAASTLDTVTLDAVTADSTTLDVATSETASPWPKACIDLPNHELYDTGCDQSMTCAGGLLGRVWSGPIGSGSSTLVFADNAEGPTSLRVDCTGTFWCGITDECPQSATGGPTSVDLSGWKTLHVSLKGNAPDALLKMASTPNDPEDFRDEAGVRASTYGYLPDDAWHALAIPLGDLAQNAADKPHHAFELAKVYKPLIVSVVDMVDDTVTYSLGIDGVYVTK